YNQRAGLIKLKQLKRKVRLAKSALESNPADAQSRSTLAAFSEQLNSTELEHYRLCMENYPTDHQAKYEYGIRLFRNNRYDEAIPLFQDAQRDPRRRIAAMDKIGMCFYAKEWFTDAIDIFSQAIDAYELKEDATAKELRYNLARSYQQNGDTEKALDIYRKIAQLDFAYKDVRQRVDQLRKKAQ
ncbi:MAG: tetratricopeptide repeat protein, partial [Planctomycetota bacterium]